MNYKRTINELKSNSVSFSELCLCCLFELDDGTVGGNGLLDVDA